MRVLFLDIDGVLNCRAFVQRAEWTPPLGSERDVSLLDPQAIALLNSVIEATGAAVVVSSSWRITYPIEALRSLLGQRGFRGHLLDVTPELVGRQRALEIASWLESVGGRDVEAFAIVDDDADAGVGFAERFVLTEFDEGLTPEQALRLTKLLTPGATR